METILELALWGLRIEAKVERPGFAFSDPGGRRRVVRASLDCLEQYHNTIIECEDEQHQFAVVAALASDPLSYIMAPWGFALARFQGLILDEFSTGRWDLHLPLDGAKPVILSGLYEHVTTDYLRRYTQCKRGDEPRFTAFARISSDQWMALGMIVPEGQH